MWSEPNIYMFIWYKPTRWINFTGIQELPDLSETSEKLDEIPINRGVQGPPFRPARGSIIPCGRRPPILGDLPVAEVADGACVPCEDGVDGGRGCGGCCGAPEEADAGGWLLATAPRAAERAGAHGVADVAAARRSARHLCTAGHQSIGLQLCAWQGCLRVASSEARRG